MYEVIEENTGGLSEARPQLPTYSTVHLANCSDGSANQQRFITTHE
jgi:hypothetical protein